MKWKIKKLKRQKLYKLAYLTFKRKKLAMLEKRGRLKEYLAMGWSAHKEWKAWLELRRPRYFETGRKKRIKLSIPVDNYQRAADRRLIALCSAQMGRKRKFGKKGKSKADS
jgi:hypothetical protein